MLLTKQDVIKQILEGKSLTLKHQSASAFAPSNIALVKYWGKRNQELNLPVTSSLSISLGDKGCETTISISKNDDQIFLNNETVALDTPFAKRLIAYLDLFRLDNQLNFCVKTQSNIPIAAGLASSASGFAALAQALDKLFDWQLTKKELSILARLGSGSASRSLWQGFVEWHQGERDDGMDSYAEALDYAWPELQVGLLIISTQTKSISSREAMAATMATSTLYQAWPTQVENDLKTIKQALEQNDFTRLGSTAENNAMAMHATMLASKPAISYLQPETIQLMQQVWQCRKEGLEIYFTQDAGPNLKLLYLQEDHEVVAGRFQLG